MEIIHRFSHHFTSEILNVTTHVHVCKNEVIVEQYHNPSQHLISGMILLATQEVTICTYTIANNSKRLNFQKYQ